MRDREMVVSEMQNFFFLNNVFSPLLSTSETLSRFSNKAALTYIHICELCVFVYVAFKYHLYCTKEFEFFLFCKYDTLSISLLGDIAFKSFQSSSNFDCD